MPRREASFTVNASPRELWRFLRDFESLCACIPGVEQVDVVDSCNATLVVREKVGLIPMIVTLRAKIESEDAPRRLHAVARAEHLSMAIDVELKEAASGTELRSAFEVAGTGPLKPIVDQLFEKRATERTAEFAERLAQRFSEAPGPAPAAEPASPARSGWLASLIQRLRRRLDRFRRSGR
jgi:carbon monoxide dehydrogenase subunit G